MTVIVEKQMTNVVMIGDGPTMTKISGSKSHADGVTNMNTATFAALENYFVAKRNWVQEYSRTRKAPSRGTACAIRLLHLLQLSLGRIPRHPLHTTFSSLQNSMLSKL
ncbi:pectinesterase/pectinesterase inhibitor 21 [Pyrus ussuriensis x Pyrus communis]|uniref:Pectinesterase/pectinesterase inhibitor 21 n=1 Tax=Pyrus ussuriensis x Pyrus communis TaxID=2448454 RepID=A0A5N5FTV2_9ROSA|nr:pectinesterase/pectinesterase inhibitor 21 [Pyrus ussuriensis x Pyrus communis]